MSRRVSLAAVWLAVAVPPVLAQGSNPADMTVDAATRRQVIDGVLARLTEAYVFPDTAVAMERAIRDRVRRGEYERITSAQALADSLTAHLQAVSQDRHLRGRYSDEPLPRLDAQPGRTPEMEARARAFGRQVNVGFVSSYLFGADSVHLNSLYWRPGNRTEHFYTRTRVPGVRYGPDRPVYVLTSRRTFSGAEEFAYNLQTRQRAVIVGDTTGGGAHPGGMQRVTDHFGVWVPTGRAINPITKTNWERVGVRPDLAVPSDQALRAAQLAALRGLRGRTTDPERRRQLDEAIAEVEGQR